MHRPICRISVAKYPNPYSFKQANYYPYLIRIREKLWISGKYLFADIYPRISAAYVQSICLQNFC